MNSLFSQPTAQVEILNFQTFTTDYVSKRYGVSKQTIIDHKRNHADEISENVHFVYELTNTNGGKQEILKWTLRGIIKLGMFIRSKEAKNFRLWAEMELEKSILAELKNAKETKERNLRLIDENSALNLELIDKSKRHKREIASYKGKLTILKNQLAEFDDDKFKPFSHKHPSYFELFKEYVGALGNNNALKIRADGLSSMLKEARSERDYFRNKYNEIYKILKIDKNKEITLSLAKIQKELEKSYTAIGAVMSYVNDDDRYFMENNEMLKG